jgi:response regulator NasT
MTPRTAPLRVAVADDEKDVRDFFHELLPRLGHELVAVAATGRELVAQCQNRHPELVITDIKMPDMDGIEASAEVNRDPGRQVPVILVSAHHDAELIVRAGADHIMAYLVKPIKEADLASAIHLAVLRFEHFQKLRQEAASLRQALEDRKVIERAKGVLMRRARVDEPEAFRRLQRLASDHNKKLVEVAQSILLAEEAFQASFRA